MATIDEQLTALATRMAQECNDIRSENGKLSDLQTTAKSTLVAAINEVLGIAQAGGGGGGSNINDGVIDTSSTWSSSKINAEIQAASGGGAPIDDGAPAVDKVWSSSKTNNEIGGQVGAAISGLTKNSVGLGNVDNTADISKPVSTLQAAADASVLQQAKDYADSLPSGGAEINDSTTGTTTVWSSQKTSDVIGAAVSGVDKTSIGLGNVDNTSDANKPVSAAQAAADNLILQQANNYTDANAIGMWNDRGNYDASSNQFPSTGGTGTAGAIEKGNIWTISVAGTLGGTAVVPKQTVRALVDNPGQTPGNWAINTADFAITQNITNGVTGQAPSAVAGFAGLQLTQTAFALGTVVQYFKGDRCWVTFASDVGTSQVGGAIGASSPIVGTDTVLTALWKAQAQINTLDAEVAAVDKTTIGLGNVDNTADINKPVSTLQAAADADVLQQANAYTDSQVGGAGAQIDDGAPVTNKVWSSSRTNDAINTAVGGVTKVSLGLGNVDNTSDANKPVSTAQAAADTNTLNAANAYADGLVVGLWDDRGNYDASGNVFPSTGGSGSAGAIRKSDIWTISVAGTLGGTSVVPGQTVRALADAPGQTASNWAISSSPGGNVADAIVDGVTNVAPSQNVVFDALALKQSIANLPTDVRAVVLTGLSLATGTAIANTDTMLAAFGKLQKQITDVLASKDATGGIVGMTQFKINFKNAADTFTSFMTNSNTASRTYTYPDRDGNVAMAELFQNSKSANYTLTLADANTMLYHPSTDVTARTFTIPANASVAYPIGTTLVFINDDSAGAITIAITSDTMRLAGSGATGSRTLAANGVATAIKLTAGTWIINGAGLT